MIDRDISLIVVHCAFTKPRPSNLPQIGVKTIRKWHVEERGWRDVGYHYVIKRDGTIQLGRPLDEPGAHVRGYNAHSIGICLVGGMGPDGEAVDNYTAQQMASLTVLVGGLEVQFPNAVVCGHNDLTDAKSCPNFDVKAWWGRAKHAG